MVKKLVLMPQTHDTEAHAYRWIIDDLREKGWITKKPSGHSNGEVYTQNEVFDHPELKKYLNRGVPENVVKLTQSSYWIIEAKKYHSELDKALMEAIDYANDINKSELVSGIIATGVAGNDSDGYLTKSKFFDGFQFKIITMNGREISGLLQKSIVQRIVSENKSDLEDVPVDKKLFLSKAENINEILHNGGINKNQRAKVMASLLLALIADTPFSRDSDPTTLIGDINNRIRTILHKEGKENFLDFVKISLPPTLDNHTKYRNALIQTLQELDSLNIRSAMNSGTDVLGEFYEVFLKYGNGAKEIGIVLTPRHITKFAVEVLNINHQDIIYDPTCGTGGFLVAALDQVKQASNDSQINIFKQHHIFGIDQEPEVVALALVNMIFRGDGKTNITEGNCFQNNIISLVIDGHTSAKYTKNSNKNEEPITKTIMNPPFALKTSDDKEYKFVDHALKQMQDGGLLFSVLPSSIMLKAGKVRSWREKLLKNNTLLAVVTFPPDLFYPIGVHSIGVFIKKGVYHPKDQNVFWIRAINDGLLKKKGKRLPFPKVPNDLQKIQNDLKSFVMNPHIKIENIPEFQKACPIDFSDKHLELVPEAYLDSKKPDVKEVEEGMERLVRQSVAYIIKSKRESSFHV